MSKPRTYIGDGVYAEFDGYHTVLTVEDCESVKHRIYLEPGLPEAVLAFDQRCRRPVVTKPEHDEDFAP